MLLKINNLSVQYGKAEVIKDLSLEVAEKEIVTIIGANGAGKTTVLRTISGLKSPAAGDIWFRGHKISGLRAHEIVRLGISHVPEGRRILAPLSVAENLEIGAYLIKNKKEAEAGFQNILNRSLTPGVKEIRQQPQTINILPNRSSTPSVPFTYNTPNPSQSVLSINPQQQTQPQTLGERFAILFPRG